MMKTLMVALALLAAAPACATEAVCTKRFAIDQSTTSTTLAAQAFSTANSSGAYIANAKIRWIKNLNSVAANEVWISSFQVTTLVSGVLDTSKATSIPGGKTADSLFFVPWGANVKTWIFSVVGPVGYASGSCE